MKVAEIFKSIEGEGSRAGWTCIFIRLHGCNLQCSYCDTRYSCNGDEYQNLWPLDIVRTVDKLANKNLIRTYAPIVTITGGEPLIGDKEEMYQLLDLLTQGGYEINIETNGTIDTSKFLEDYSKSKSGYDSLVSNIFFTIDYKCKSSGMSDFMDITKFYNLQSKDIIKFVVGSEEDLIQMLSVYHDLKLHRCKAEMYASPVFEKIKLVDIVSFIINNDLEIRFQVQLHKLIWSPETRGV